MAYKSPQALREAELVIEDGTKLGDVIADFQRDRFLAWDERDRVYCESCVGSSKTSDIAGWCLSELVRNKFAEGLVYAYDRDQAARILDQARGYLNRNKRLRQILEVDRNRIKRFEKRGKKAVRLGEVKVESSDVASAEGLIGDFVICEQLESWRHEELWEAIISRSHKRRMKILVIANAPSSEEDWTFRVREMARTSDRWTWIEITADQVPWIQGDHLAEMRETLRPATFERLYYNRVGSAEEAIFTPEQVEAMTQERAKPVQNRPAGIYRIALALDLGLKHDLAVLSAVGEQASGDQVLLNMTAWQGSRENPVDIEEVENEVRAFWAFFYPNIFLYDPWQFERSAQMFTKGAKVLAEPFEFRAKNISEMTRQLWRRGVDRRFFFYPGAGVTVRKGEAWDLAREFRTVKIKEGLYGYSLDTKGEGTKDRTISVGMASWWLAQSFVPHSGEHITVLDEDDEEDGFLGKREMRDLKL